MSILLLLGGFLFWLAAVVTALVYSVLRLSISVGMFRWEYDYVTTKKRLFRRYALWFACLGTAGSALLAAGFVL